MKTITKIIKSAIVFCCILTAGKMSAQSCTANFGYNVFANGYVTFTSTSAPVNSITTQYYWNLGNGATYSNTGGPGMTTNTTYTANGNYTVTLFVLTPPGFSCSINAVITITNAGGCALNANFNYSQGASGLVNFNNTTTGTIPGVTYAWGFGDGGTSALTSPAHTYSANGVYIATLVATNNATCIATKVMSVVVNSYCTLVANYSHTVGANGVTNFQSTSTGTLTGYSYKWQFGDGGITVGGPSVNHTYINGTYYATLTVMNNTVAPTCTSSVIDTIVVTTNTCNLSANFSSTVNAGGNVSFASTTTGTNANTTYTWNFGNGFTSNSANPNITYQSGGIWVVTLIAKNAANCTSVISKTINVNTIACVANANFTLVPTFTAQYWTAIPNFPWNVVAAQWSWGDGATTNSLYASHQYSATGMYTICLSVTVSCGATASSCASYSVFRSSQNMNMIYINVQAPQLQDASASEVGISENRATAFDMAVMPNPSNGNFVVNVIGLSEAPAYISVYNLVGGVVSTSSYEPVNGTITKELNLQSVPSGIYFLKVEADNKSYTKKIVINK